MDYLNMKVADITSRWVRKNFDVAAEQTQVTRVVETPIYLFEITFNMPLSEFFDKLNEIDRNFRRDHACLNQRSPDEITTKIHHAQDFYDNWECSYERHIFTMDFEYQELEREQETVERLREEVQKKIRAEKAKAKAAAQRATLKQKKAELKRLEIQNEFELYQKLKKKFEE